ncbi:hypothetical protein SDC9_74757 [bioreactor metagenome]|uniref:Uncharacterized protein n=1 Tax=bioreactor metagenome TaxID=1076179 RepID=A0A644YJP5_9ZZZZ
MRIFFHHVLQSWRQGCAAKTADVFDLAGTEDRHDAGSYRNIDATLQSLFMKTLQVVIVKSDLSNQKTSACLNFFFQMEQIFLLAGSFRMAFRVGCGGNKEFFAGGNALNEITSVYFVNLLIAVFRRISAQGQDVFQISAGNFVQNSFNFFVTAADTGQVCQCFGAQFIFNVLGKFKRFTMCGTACTVSYTDKIRF